VTSDENRVLGAKLGQVRFLKASHFQKVLEKSDLQRLVAVNRNRKPDDAAKFALDVVAAVDAEKCPAVSLEKTAKLLAGDRFHTTISSTRSLPVCLGVLISTERHPSTAS
jgi:hypothetical protein